MLYKLYAHYTNILSLGNKPRFLLLPFVLTRESLAKEKNIMEILRSVYQILQFDFYTEIVHLNLT